MQYLLPLESFLRIIGTLVALSLLYQILTTTYRLTLHPLAKYPGPPLWATTRLPWGYNCMIGKLPFKVLEFHKRYGPIVRIAPDELVFSSEEAWQDIYGKPSSRNIELRKDPHQFGFLTEEQMQTAKSMVIADNGPHHARLRRNFASGFSAKTLGEQELILNKYFDLLIQRLKDNCGKPVDLTEWFNYATFDIIGDLTLGESFGCLENSSLHFWVKTVHESAWVMSILGMTQKFYPLDKLILFFISGAMKKRTRDHKALVEKMVRNRMERKDARLDLMTYAQRQLNKPDGLSLPEASENGGLLIIAGSETTASGLSGGLFYLLTNPLILQRLTHEIRTSFKTPQEINIASVSHVPYLLAVVQEILRIYPPAAGSMCRITPPTGCFIASNFIPENTYISINQYASNHLPQNFYKPDEFIPERWLDSNNNNDSEFKNDKRNVMQPFSVGLRNCIGKNLAYVELRVIIARMVWEFDMELDEVSKEWDKDQSVYVVPVCPPLMARLKPVVRK